MTGVIVPVIIMAVRFTLCIREIVLLSLICLRCILVSNAPTGTLEPAATNNVLEGGTAVFTCIVTGRMNEDLLWQIKAGSHVDNIEATVNSNVTVSLNIGDHHHGHY